MYTLPFNLHRVGRGVSWIRQTKGHDHLLWVVHGHGDIVRSRHIEGVPSRYYHPAATAVVNRISSNYLCIAGQRIIIGLCGLHLLAQIVLQCWLYPPLICATCVIILPGLNHLGWYLSPQDKAYWCMISYFTLCKYVGKYFRYEELGPLAFAAWLLCNNWEFTSELHKWDISNIGYSLLWHPKFDGFFMSLTHFSKYPHNNKLSKRSSLPMFHIDDFHNYSISNSITWILRDPSFSFPVAMEM